ncbi:MAG: polyprenyl synthetase family protein [Ruminococcus sp.]|nr:polyprenyl synthetase family protein [Ruminococcus sp.]
MNASVTQKTDKINASLESYFAHKPELIKSVLAAEEYSVTAGGKRIRPLLMLLFCEACNANSDSFIDVSTCIEMIHSFSLIHDDLPCMDNDDYRRGKPSCHKKFGEATALLAGDALTFAAFEKIYNAAQDGVIDSKTAITLVGILSAASGSYGMVGGQIIDIESENKQIPLEVLKELQSKKTGALISAACEMGCVLAGCDEKRQNAREYAYNLGLAFQIVDDILDVEGSFETLGKPIGSDSENNKTTFVSLFGLQKAKQLAREYTQAALDALDAFENAEDLKELTSELLIRQN